MIYKEDSALLFIHEDGRQFPIWPAKEYAVFCANNLWTDYQPTMLALDEFIEKMIPRLIEDQIAVCVFPTPQDSGIRPEINTFLNDLEQESEWY